MTPDTSSKGGNDAKDDASEARSSDSYTMVPVPQELASESTARPMTPDTSSKGERETEEHVHTTEQLLRAHNGALQRTIEQQQARYRVQSDELKAARGKYEHYRAAALARFEELEDLHKAHHDRVNRQASQIAEREARIEELEVALREYTKLANAKNPDIARSALGPKGPRLKNQDGERDDFDDEWGPGMSDFTEDGINPWQALESASRTIEQQQAGIEELERENSDIIKAVSGLDDVPDWITLRRWPKEPEGS
jgi:hypothetical protein